MSRKLTKEEVLKRIKEKHGNKITINNYLACDKHADFTCNICGNIWETAVTCIINQGTGCPNCGNNKGGGGQNRLTFQDVEKKLLKKHEGNITLLKYGGTSHKESEFKCNRCGNIFISDIHNVLHQKYACRKCWLKEMGKIKSGRKSNLWKGGITKLRPYIKCTLDSWKELSMKNSNYKCVACSGAHSFDDIHHLYSLSNIIEDSLIELGYTEKDRMIDYGEENIQKIVSKVLELHFKHPSGVCLCKNSHKKFHKIYGKENNTPEEFYEFVDKIKSKEIILK